MLTLVPYLDLEGQQPHQSMAMMLQSVASKRWHLRGAPPRIHHTLGHIVAVRLCWLPRTNGGLVTFGGPSWKTTLTTLVDRVDAPQSR